MTQVSNPLLPGCYPDPSVCRVGDWFYLVSSTFEYLPGLPVMRSRDLVTWETIGHVIDRSGMLDYDGLGSSGGLFAPTIRFHDGMFWVVCTLVDRASQPSESPRGNFLVTAADPAGPWSDPIWLDVDGIDPSIAFGSDGRVWLHGTRLVPEAEAEWFHQTQVWVREYSPTAQALIGPEHIVWTGAVRGAVWAEGPHLYEIDGRWYLLAAEGGTEFHHAVAVARSDSPTGPFEGNKGNPILTHRHLGRTGVDVIGPGHADLVQARDGSWWALLLAMRAPDRRHYPLGRETFLVPVTWEDGWPVFAPGAGRVPATVEVPWAHEPMAADSWQPDDRAPGIVGPGDARWTTPRALPAEVAQADADGWILPASAATLAEPTTATFVGVRQQHFDVDCTVSIDASGLAEGETAGFAIRQSEDDHVTAGFTRRGSGFTLAVTHRRAGTDIALHTAQVASGGSVGVRARGYRYELVHERTGHGAQVLAEVDARELDAVSTGGFLGVWFGVYATSHGAEPRGTARADRFAYVPA
ncbi:glycoside hydrolase family 43 protein [Microbacterium stercoris]|uniref:Family 43 glycosylhydrolase n=1 Tax=Microbacterium stercoris TaxID=2820289 RepID=A0A939QMC8_9MICO|nr:glycoside hydrolase family 43 protein [Microbacterium stercoris]MBO3662091.1 family 43 glycosylhydrolase [Microbacterium stercoris]